jgi:hypothetical protein
MGLDLPPDPWPCGRRRPTTLKRKTARRFACCGAITATGGLMATKSLGVLRAISILTIHAQRTFLPHVTQLEVASPRRTAPAAGDASVPLSRASFRWGTQQPASMIRSSCSANEARSGGSIASVMLVACRRSPKCLFGVKLEQGIPSGLGAAGRHPSRACVRLIRECLPFPMTAFCRNIGDGVRVVINWWRAIRPCTVSTPSSPRFSIV